MLSLDEFTVGTIANASPLSLVLGRDAYEPPTLIGWANDKVVAVQLAGQQAFHCYESSQAGNTGGIVIPKVRIEVDESSAFNTQYGEIAPGSVVRTECLLGLQAHFFRAIRPSLVTLHDGLVSTGAHQAGFRRWQIVLGEGLAKRTLWGNASPSSGGACTDAQH